MNNTSKTLLIAGCGYVGLALSRHMVSQGWSVWGLRRTAGAGPLIEQAGARPLIADLTDRRTLASLPVVDRVVCCQAPGRNGDYRVTYLKTANNLVSILNELPLVKLVWVSSTSVYGQSSGEWVDELTPPQPSSPQAQWLLEAESVMRSARCGTIVLRLGGIYGPGRDRLNLLRGGRVAIESDAYLNQVHIDDVVGIIDCLLERGQVGGVYLGVDDEPVKRRVFYQWLARQRGIILPVGAPREENNPPQELGKRCSNRKIRELGYQFRYPNYRMGFLSFLNEAYPDGNM